MPCGPGPAQSKEERVKLPDYAWVWFDHELGAWVLECWVCDTWQIVVGVRDTDRTHAVQVVNFHNARQHGGRKP